VYSAHSEVKATSNQTQTEAAPSDAGDVKVSKDFVVSGEDKFKVRTEKMLRNLFVDIDKPVQSLLMESSELSQRMLPDKEIMTYEMSGLTSNSSMTASPWLSLITKQPLIVVKVPQTTLAIDSWKFSVLDEAGTPLFFQQGRGRLPESFVWDGVCKDGRILETGESYYYSISLIDKSGTPHFTTSKPRRLISLAYYRNNNLNVSLLSSTLFDEKIRSQVSVLGCSLLNESCDYLIKDLGRMTVIRVSSNNPKLAQAQAETVRDFIVNKLALPKDDFKLEILPSLDPSMDSVKLECVR